MKELLHYKLAAITWLTGLLIQRHHRKMLWDTRKVWASRELMFKEPDTAWVSGVSLRGGAAGGMITRIGYLASALHCCLFEINLTTHDLAGLGLCLDMSLCLSTPATGILLGINKYVKQAFLCISCMQPLWKISHLCNTNTYFLRIRDENANVF